jgi:hypothetical protein
MLCSVVPLAPIAAATADVLHFRLLIDRAQPRRRGMDGARQAYLDIRAAAEQHDDILGLVVTGSRGKGFANQWSDYDFALFVTDEAFPMYATRYRQLPARAHLYLFTLTTFAAQAAWGSDMQWQRYTWAHCGVEFDRSGGMIQQLLDEKSHVPLEHVDEYVRISVHQFINQVYHSIKSLRVGNMTAYRLEAAECVRPFLQAMFGVHDRRLVPYYKYLRWELETYPLAQLSIPVHELLRDFEQVLTAGDYRIQQKLLLEIQRVFRTSAYGYLFSQYWVRFSLSYPTPIDD